MLVNAPVNTPPPAVQDPDELDLWDLIGAAWRRKWLVLGAALLLGAASYAASYLVTPVYRAELVASVVSSQPESSRLSSLVGQFGGLAALAGVQVPESKSEEEAVAVLRSRAFTEDFIRRHGLMQKLFAGIWDADAGAWLVDDPEDAPSLEDAWVVFDQGVRRVSKDPETGLLTVLVDWTDPGLAAQWANQLVADVNDALRRRAVDEAERSIAYLNRELERTGIVEVRQAIYSLLEHEIQKIMLANVRDQYAFKVIDPAQAPEEDRYVEPNRMLLAVAGLVLGGFAGTAVALLLEFAPLRRRRARA